jgi:radical SAM superfamily enzyme YgiQ (UPF0313 family)
MIRPGLAYSRGLLTLAACLELDGFEVKYLVHSDPQDRADILNLAAEADAVGITVMTPTLHIASSICKDIKNLNPETLTILGGPHPSQRALEILSEDSNIDFVIIGEAERRLPLLLRSTDKPDTIGGVAFRQARGEAQLSSVPIAPVSVPQLPMPAYHLLRRSLSQYGHNIKTARGCPYQCTFCVERSSWRSSRLSSHTIEQVLQELEFLAVHLRSGTLLHFSDAILNLDKDRTHEMVDRIKRAQLNLFYSFDTRVDLVDFEEIRELSAAGFIYVRMGFESVQDKVLKINRKSTTRQKEELASQIIREAFPAAAIHAYLVTGLPGSTRQSIAADVDNIRELTRNDRVDIIGNKILVPYPGTPSYEDASDLGIEILTHDWSKYDRRSYPVFRLDSLSANEIYFGYLHQEAALAEEYFKKIGDVPSKDDVSEGLDYLYENYAGRDY